MPLYEFTCLTCINKFEVLVSIGNEKDTSCPTCGTGNIRKCVSTFGIGGTNNLTSSSSLSCSTCSSGKCSTCR